MTYNSYVSRTKQNVIYNDDFKIMWYFTAFGNTIIEVSCKKSDYYHDVEFIYSEERLFRIPTIQSAMIHE